MITTPPDTLTLFVRGQLVNPTNQRWKHWRARHKWSSEWRERTAMACHLADTRAATFKRLRGQTARGGKLRVLFTPVGPRRFDDDGIVAALKPVRDELASLFLTRDGPEDGHTWTVGPQGVTQDRTFWGVTLTVTVEPHVTDQP